MIARWSFAILVIVLATWLYWLTALVMRAIDRAEQLIDREHRVLPEVSLTQLAAMYGGGELSAEEFDAEIDRRVPPLPEAKGRDWYAKLRAGAEWANARMQPTFLEPESATEPVPVVRPSPVPREPAPLVTEPMEIADELAADAHAHIARDLVLSDEEWQAKQDAEHAAFMAWLAGETKEVGS